MGSSAVAVQRGGGGSWDERGGLLTDTMSCRREAGFAAPHQCLNQRGACAAGAVPGCELGQSPARDRLLTLPFLFPGPPRVDQESHQEHCMLGQVLQ